MPTDPAAILAQLRAAGLHLELDPAGRLLAGPRAALTPEVRQLIHTHKPALVAALDRYQDAAEFCQERAAIMEFDGGLTRLEAEFEAARLTVARFRLHGDEGAGTVIAPGSTFTEVLAELSARYGARLADVQPLNRSPDDE